MVCPGEPLTRAQVAKLLVGVFGLTAPVGFDDPWKDVDGMWYEHAARIAAHHRLWDTSAGWFNGGEKITRAEFAEVVVEAMGEDLCTNDPFTAARVLSLDTRFPGQSFTAYAYDTRSRCAYWMNPNERLRTASVFKVLVMAGTLLEAQKDGRGLSSWERSQLVPMITESTNEPVRDTLALLWRLTLVQPAGGHSSSWIKREPVGDTQSVWGRATTSAKDQAALIRRVFSGDWGRLRPEYRAEAWDLMTSVVPSQTWGVTQGVPAGWTVAQKNGFAGHIANSVGFVQAPGSSEGYVVAVLSNGWSSWQRGVPAVEEIAGWVSAELAH